MIYNQENEFNRNNLPRNNLPLQLAQHSEIAHARTQKKTVSANEAN